jgi:uncharacterized repeat protein (TIGR03803 family)
MRQKRGLYYAICALAGLVLSSLCLAAPKYKILHAFGVGSDGAGLWGSLARDSAGNLYGTTSGGGAYGYGTVFELTPGADGAWAEKILHSFRKNDPDGDVPTSGPILDPAGSLYATTPSGGGPDTFGTVFELSPGPDWKLTVIHRFGRNDKTAGPYTGVVSHEGKLWGAEGCDFTLTPSSHAWKETILSCLPGGGLAIGGPVFDSFGNAYGSTQHGGKSKRCGGGCGTVYELSPQGDDKWKETILHSFQAYWDGSYPGLGALTLDASGNVYGTADGGNSGYGVIFRMSLDSNGRWKETVLYNLAGGAEGDHPGAGVVMDKAGNLYGTTIAGGAYDSGVVYKLAPGKNGKWTYTVLHTFDYSDGAQPDANMILDEKGNLYGTTATGGPGGYGVAFELTP